MNTQIATALATGNAEDAAAALIAAVRTKLGASEPVLIMAFASTKQPLGEVVGPLAREFPSATVLGSSTAGEFSEKGDSKGSVSIFALAGDYKIFAGMALGLKNNPEGSVMSAIEGLPRELQGYPHRTGILLLDTMAGNGEEVTLIAGSYLGEAPLAGGAAGDDLKMKATQVACGETAANDAVVIAQIFSKAPLGLGVCHGHQPLSAPLRVTKASGNVIEELEGRPAWDIWKMHTRESAAKRGVDSDKLTAAEEGPYMLRYEAGLAAGSTYKIRAPLSRAENGSMSFACGVPEGSVIRITESDPESQIASAREAARRARAQLGEREPAGALVFDCICRNLILNDKFASAVEGMAQELGGAPLAGFETYGEIALDAGDLSGFHNTTSVVLVFPQD